MTTIIPIRNKLRRKHHKDLAEAQDLLVIQIYNSFPETVIHGGTAIWRCYGGNRFSEDIDVYLPTTLKNSKDLKKFCERLEKEGFKIEKFKETENSVFSKFSRQNTIVSFEAVFKDLGDFITKPFEMSDSTFTTVYTLSPEELLKEKVSAYIKRRKVRDIYDIFFLLNFVEDKKGVREYLKSLMKDFQKPEDENELKTLIITGAVPNLKDILEGIKRWEK